MAKKKHTVKHSPSALESPIIQIGIVFVILAALFLMFYAGQFSAMYR